MADVQMTGSSEDSSTLGPNPIEDMSTEERERAEMSAAQQEMNGFGAPPRVVCNLLGTVPTEPVISPQGYIFDKRFLLLFYVFTLYNIQHYNSSGNHYKKTHRIRHSIRPQPFIDEDRIQSSS